MNKSIQYLIAGASAIILVAGLKSGAELANPILVSMLLAICIAPLPEWLTRKGLATNLSLAITFLLILALGLLTAILLTNSIAGLSESFPVYVQKLTAYYNNLEKFAKAHHLNISELINKANVAPEKIIGFAQSITGSITSLISSSLVILLLTVFFVIELVGYEYDTMKGKRNKLSMHDWMANLSGDLRKYITINALEGLILGTMNFIFMLVMGVDFAFLWAFLSFFMNFIPNIGFILSVVPPALVALIILGPTRTLIVIIGFWLINFFVENVLGPLFMKQSLNVSILNSFLSMMIWSWILGMPGAILGVPLTMVVMKIHSEVRGKNNIQQFL
jgi:AI-2 transport protein TqsA